MEVAMIDGIKSGFFDNYNNRDWEALKKIYTEDAVIHSYQCKGGQAVVDIAKRKLKAIPDFKFTPLYSSYENNTVVVHWCAEGTAAGSIMHPEKEKVVFSGCNQFRISDGKVAEQWENTFYCSLKQPISSASSLGEPVSSKG